MLVAIDGPSAAGKSTVARMAARELGFSYLDSGAMYRCVALLWLASPGRDPAQLARTARIELSGERVLLEGRDVSEQIRAAEVSQASSLVAADAGVREALVAKMRALMVGGDWVAEGRDIGTVVAPQAAVKIFLTASAQARAHRRATQVGAEEATVLAEQGVRDERDSTRAHAPLRAAPGAVQIDTTGVQTEEVVARVVALARAAASSD